MSVRVTVTLDDGLHQRLEERARLEDRSISFLLARGAELELAMVPVDREHRQQPTKGKRK